MFKPQLVTPQWLALPQEVRAKFVEVFHIKKSGCTQIFGNKLMSDGCTHEDLAVVTVEKMQEFLGSTKQDFYVLLNDCVKKITGGPENVIETVNKVEEIVVPKQFCTQCDSKGVRHKLACPKYVAISNVQQNPGQTSPVSA